MGRSPIPNQKEDLKVSRYADDRNFFVVTEKSIVEILNCFKQYEIATGATINISKTTAEQNNPKLTSIRKILLHILKNATQYPIFKRFKNNINKNAKMNMKIILS